MRTPAIPIGVTARNEARNILALLESLRTAAARATAELGVHYEIYVLLNDNDDETPRLLAGQADISVWDTRGGIVEAQRALVDRRGRDAPFLVFSDADIVVHQDALLEITRTMLECPEVEVAYAEKYPVKPLRRGLLARALYLYNLREGYQTRRHYFNGQFFAIRRWAIPSAAELKWDPARDNGFLHLASGIRCDDIYLSREILRSAGPEALCCLPAGIQYRPPETLRGMFRKYQRMRLEIERLHCYSPETEPVHRQWGMRRLDRSRLRAARGAEKLYYALFQSALFLCRIAYRGQRFYYSRFAAQPCPTWAPVTETKERVH